MDILLSYISWDASPEIVRIGSFQLRWYGLLFASGFLIGLYIVRRMFKEENAPEKWLDQAFIYIVIGAVVGARLGHVFFYAWDDYANNLSEIPMIWRGGLASHGGAIGIILALLIYSKVVTKKSVLWILDKVVVPTALAGCFIRLGNLMNSEIVGLSTSVPWAFEFVRHAEMYNIPLEPRHPVQLYESICYLISFLILYRTYWKSPLRKKRGFMFGLFLVLIFGFRIIMEVYKTPQGGFENAIGGGLTTGQMLSIPFVLIGLYYLFRPAPSENSPNQKAKVRRNK